jgi:hypothetical protein
MNGVTIAVTKTPAMALKARMPRTAEGTRLRGGFWAVIQSRVRDDRNMTLNGSRQMTRWEYMTTPLIIHNTAAILNNWGSDGWELVQVITGPEGGLVAYFKREKADD